MPRIRAALVAAVALSVLAPSAAAVADTATLRDGKGDSWEQTADGYAQAGSPVNADVTRSVVRHSARRVTVTTRFVDLRNNAEGVLVGVRLRTNEGVRRVAIVGKEPSTPGAMAFLANGRGDLVRCKGLSRRIDWAADTVQVSVPRRCLSAPRWVQATVAGGNFGEGDSSHSYMDVAGTAGHRFSAWSAKIRR